MRELKVGDKVRYTGAINPILYVKGGRTYTVNELSKYSSTRWVRLEEIRLPHAYFLSDLTLDTKYYWDEFYKRIHS